MARSDVYIASAQSEQTLTTQNTWEAISGTWTAGTADNMETPTAAGILETSDQHFGYFDVSWQVVLTSTGEEDIEVGVAVDGSIQAKTVRPLTPLENQSTKHNSGEGLSLSLTGSQQLQLYARCTSNDSIGITVQRAYLKASQDS